MLKDQSANNKFIFYEVYKNTQAVDIHKKTPHYKLWTDFKESGGVVSSVSSKNDALSFSDEY